jgi:hypothetical protein
LVAADGTRNHVGGVRILTYMREDQVMPNEVTSVDGGEEPLIPDALMAILDSAI